MHNVDHAAIISGVVSFLSYCFGIVNPQLEVLLWAMSLDIVIGIFASFINPKLMYNSQKTFRGIAKKIVLLTLVCFAHQLDNMMGINTIALTTCYFFIVNEGMSCLENAGKCGLKLPPIIQNSLEQLKGITDNEHKKH